MKFKTFMTIHSIALAYFGFGTLLVTEPMWTGIYGISLGGNSVWLVRLIGVVVIGNMALTLAARTQNNNPGRMAIMTTFSGEWLLYAILAFVGQLAGAYNVLNWSNVVVALLFSLGLFLYRDRNPGE